MTELHQLAAIIFTDIVGYTVFTRNDEQNSFSLLEKNRKLHKPIIQVYH